ncbi:MAG: hypothetical protein LC723_04810 [Actinobacteria bacterium]|nr:hypothetical protein [Actinomycetota bacterium]
MRLSDLIGTPAFGTGRVPFGKVTDVRMSQGGPTIGTFGSAYKIDGLIVSKRQTFGRLGYDRADMKGPWMLRAITKALQASAIYVPWESVVSWDKGEVEIDGSMQDFSAPPMIIGSA